jgi:hypothetical protein
MATRPRMMLAALLGLSALVAGVAESRAANRKSVLDYYLMLPPEAGGEGTREERLAAIEKQAPRQGYLRFQVGGVDTTELKVFKLSDGTPLLALAHTGCCCKGRCVRRLRFMADRPGGLVDVTGKVWRELSVEDRREAVERRLPAKDRWMGSSLADTAVYRLPPATAAVHFESEGRVFLRFRLVRDVFVRF